jgi:hypothetical protein
VDVAADQLIEAKRYGDVVQFGNPEAAFARDRAALASGSNSAHTEVLETFLRQRLIDNGTKSVEALAGAGQIERAKALADKVLEFDNSPATRGQLVQRVERAGSAEMGSYLKTQ